MACDACLRRSRLLGELAGRLDHLHAKRGMLDETFALGDDDLVAALMPQPGDRRRLRARLRKYDGDTDREHAAAAGLGVVCRHEDRYPPSLRGLAGAPSALYLAPEANGALLLDEPLAAIVGARRASHYALEVARSLGRGLAAAGVTVVSGLALGIDSAAHAGTLAGDGRTVAVMAGGADVAYPRSKAALHAEIAERGLVVSEMPPGFQPRRWSFPARNRIIAGLAAVTIVVEAAQRSGALITARAAREMGREVGAVPGQVTSPVASGSNALLRDGAHLIDSPQAVLDLLFGVGVRRAEPVRDGRELEPRLRRVLDGVRAGRETVGALTRGRDARVVLAALAELELRGYLRRAAGGAYVPLSYPEER